MHACMHTHRVLYRVAKIKDTAPSGSAPRKNPPRLKMYKATYGYAGYVVANHFQAKVFSR